MKRATVAVTASPDRSDWYRLELDIRDPDGAIRGLLNDIAKQSRGGHSFHVAVDPEEKGGTKYFIDGDGSDKIHSIRVKSFEDM